MVLTSVSARCVCTGSSRLRLKTAAVDFASAYLNPFSTRLFIFLLPPAAEMHLWVELLACRSDGKALKAAMALSRTLCNGKRGDLPVDIVDIGSLWPAGL